MSTTGSPASVEVGEDRPLSNWYLVASASLGSLAWLAHIAAMPALVPLACETGRSWPLHLATVLTALVAVVGLIASYRARARVAERRGARSADDGAQRPRRSIGRDLLERGAHWSTYGVVLNWLFLMLILAEHVPVLMVDACPP